MLNSIFHLDLNYYNMVVVKGPNLLHAINTFNNSTPFDSLFPCTLQDIIKTFKNTQFDKVLFLILYLDLDPLDTLL